jgi:hypothetical protein
LFSFVPFRAVNLNVVVFYSKKLKSGAREVYNRIAGLVNEFKASYRFKDKPIDMIETGTMTGLRQAASKVRHIV